MDPQSTFCPNLDCPARGQSGQGNIISHGRSDRAAAAKSAKPPSVHAMARHSIAAALPRRSSPRSLPCSPMVVLPLPLRLPLGCNNAR